MKESHLEDSFFILVITKNYHVFNFGFDTI